MGPESDSLDGPEDSLPSGVMSLVDLRGGCLGETKDGWPSTPYGRPIVEQPAS